jgi:hypothetical protein
MRRPPQSLQMLGSVLIALAIAAIAVVAVTAHLGPTSVAGLEAREDVVKQREEVREEREKAREDLLEESSGGPGPG